MLFEEQDDLARHGSAILLGAAAQSFIELVGDVFDVSRDILARRHFPARGVSRPIWRADDSRRASRGMNFAPPDKNSTE
jgi:hypothetical protein